MADDRNSLTRRRYGLVLVLCLMVLAGLRLRWVGHLLVWDEAMNLCTVRAFMAGGVDDFSNWFWRHPPLFCVLMLMLRPMASGFAERAELMTIAFAALNAVLVFAINRRAFNLRTALWSVLLLAVMPGSVFFDVWIKRDLPAATFGLLAVLLLLHRKLPYAALALGLAFLSKETGLFYAVGCGMLWALGVAGRRTLGSLAVLAGVPLLACGWWYAWLSTANHVHFAVGRATGFNSPWFFYLQRIVHDLGWGGVILAALGVTGLAADFWNRRQQRDAAAAPWGAARLWPVCVLAPALLLLSVLPSKVPWIVIVLFPAWATLQAAGMVAALDRLPDMVGRIVPVRRGVVSQAAPAVAVLLVGGLAWPLVGRDYEATLRRVDMGQWRGADYSREIAQTMNREVADGERVLMTSFYYWSQLISGHACAVFAYYFTRDAAVLVRPYDRSFEDLWRDVREYKIDWALLSPPPGEQEQNVFGGFMQQLGLEPIRMRTAFLFRTTPLLQAGE